MVDVEVEMSRFSRLHCLVGGEVMPYVRSSGPLSGAGGALYLNELHSDVSIVVENGENSHRFPAHSLLLCSMSEVLRTMFESDMTEKSTKRIRMLDSSPDVIKQFLKFIYTGDVVVNEWRDVLDLLAVAHKYQVEPLVTICEKQLIESVSLSSVFLLHEVAQLYSLQASRVKTQKLMLDGGFILCSAEGFDTLSKKSIELLVSSTSLNVENEVSVLNALKQWAIAECCRNGDLLSKQNILNAMEPLLQHIRFSFIPPHRRNFIPDSLVTAYSGPEQASRVKYFVPPVLHDHMVPLKFVVELGSFINKTSVSEPLYCLKFSVDTNLFILGFRLVGMFRNNFAFGTGNPMLVLCKESARNNSVQFDLSSVPWKSGASVGDYVWREIVAYFPHPARVDPFTTYSLTVKYGNLLPTKWPKTRIENNNLTTEMGPMAIYTFGQCAGITELFMLPAPPLINSCNE